MIARCRAAVNKNSLPVRCRRLLVPLIVTLAAYLILLPPGINAREDWPEGAVGFYTENGETHWLIPGQGVDIDVGGYSPSELEALHPMPTEAEKAIVHQVPPCPVVIDGITYKPEEISLFDGIRLRFVYGYDGILYAFTTAEGLERFLEEQTVAREADPLLSVFFKDWFFMGDAFTLSPGCGLPVLSQIGYNDSVSSAWASELCSCAVLCEDDYYLGDAFVMLPGSQHQALSLEGWNDRASSAYVYG